MWFTGNDGKVRGVTGAAQNCGYDDEHGSYIKVCCQLGAIPVDYRKYSNCVMLLLKTPYSIPQAAISSGVAPNKVHPIFKAKRRMTFLPYVMTSVVCRH